MTASKPLAKQLLRLMIAAAPAVAIADHPLAEGEQWNCQPIAGGDWQCQSETAAGKYRRAELPKKRQPQTSTTAAASGKPDNAWDWVGKAQLKDPSVCKTGCDGAYIEPTRDWEDAEQKPDNAPLRADANATISNNESVELSGDVLLTQGYRSIRAGEAVLDRRSNILQVKDNVEVREPDLLIRADNASFNTETQLGSFKQARFLQHSSGYRGNAQSLQRSSSAELRIEQGMITQCTPEDEVWRFDASEIVLDTDEGWGKARHARLYVQDVPLFYTPYITFPIDDRRKTGLLWPTIASSNDNGAELSVPYYLNLAPNYDATITPRYVEKRGPMLELETRYLNQFGEWVLAGADLQQDELYKETDTANVDDQDDEIPPREHRWIGQLNHSGNILGISTFIDYSKASDVDFLDDFSTNSFEQKRRSNLNQEARLGFRSDDWQLEVKAQEFQILDEFLSGQYKLMPQFTIEKNSTGKNFEPEYLFEAEYTDFQHDDSIDQGGNFVTGDRAFAEAGVSYPMRWAPGFIIPTAKVRSVSYDLEEFTPGSDDSPSATVPLATLDMGLIFERNMGFNSQSYTQTLEPRVYYFYSDYKEQDANPNFDTRELTFSFSQLYRDTRFSGHDRLDDANQVSIGLTSRFIDNEQGREQLTLSLGQIFYLEDRLVNLDSTTTLEDTRPDSNIAAEIQYQPTDNLWLTNSILWDPRDETVDEGGFGFHYQSESKTLFNLGYRFRRDGDPLAGVGLRDLSQADASLAVPLTDRWSAYARYRYDVEGNRSLDDLFGLQYEDCCWMVRLLYQQGLDDERYDALSDEIIVERDYAFILEFQLKGLGSLGSKAISALEESILGYEDLE